MLNKLPKSLRTVFFFLLLGTCGLQISRTATAEPVTVPLHKDVLKGEREAVSRTGGADVKAPLPDNGALVGGNGVVEPADREVRIAAQVSAVVSKVLVKEGDHVKAGQVLLTLNSGVEQAALAAAEADAAAERANSERAQRGLRVEDRDAISAEADAARSRADLSQGVLARTERLAQGGAVTSEELDRARRQSQVDQATFKATEARLRAAAAGSRAEDVAFARARVLAAEARVQQARATVERLTIRAPQDGEVLQVKIRQGELYSFQGTEPLMLLGDTRRLRVRMDVDERDIARVAQGSSAYVMADAFGSRRFSGTVVEVGRRFGRKNIRTDDPTERNDTKVLEVVLELEGEQPLVVGQRVTSFITAAPQG